MSDKLFTQDEVNRIVQERLAQEKNKFNADQAKLLQETLARAEKAEQQIISYESKIKEQRILNDLESALVINNATAPKELSSILQKYVTVTEEGNTVFSMGDKNVNLQDGVKGWLLNNTWAVKANPQGGGGSPAGGGGIGDIDDQLRDTFGLSPKQ